jgi:CheY-like chemotaxis protein
MPHKLLLADDSVTIQRVIELTFADEDVQVVAVGDGKQAIDRVQSERPDIVLADVGMPERDGYEVAAFIKGNPDLAHIPVLLLTGAFEPVDDARAKSVGCDGVLVKPFEPQLVIARVKDLLAARRTPAPAAPPQPPARAPIPVASAKPAPAEQAQPKATDGSLEDYFDRLDAAFASVGAPPKGEAPDVREVNAPPVPFRSPGSNAPSSAERSRTAEGDLASWDPDLTGDPARPAAATAPIRAAGATASRPSIQSAATAPRPVSPSAAPPRTAAAPQAPPAPSLAEAFAALLAAERGEVTAPPGGFAAPVPEATIDAIVQRVLDRMTGDTVRETVVDVAERLVREEIERIKGS